LLDLWYAVEAFIERGGQVLWLIALTLFLMWTMILERLWYFRSGHQEEIQRVVALWNAREETHSWHAHQIRTALISQIRSGLSRSVGMIQSLVALCPLLGLLGTVTGMIGVFEIMSLTGSSNAARNSRGAASGAGSGSGSSGKGSISGSGSGSGSGGGSSISTGAGSDGATGGDGSQPPANATNSAQRLMRAMVAPALRAACWYMLPMAMKPFPPPVPKAASHANHAAEASKRPPDAPGTADLPPGLYVVATPIGNLGDLSDRARAVLAGVDIVACEDTRRTGRLLKTCGIDARFTAYHDHNAPRALPGLRAALARGALWS